MTFQSTEELGYPDPKRNYRGRPRKSEEDKTKVKTKRQVKDRELLTLLRKIKPHVSTAIQTAVKTMNSNIAPEASKLKAAVIILDNYKELVKDVFDQDETDLDNDYEEENETTPAFSLHVMEPVQK